MIVPTCIRQFHDTYLPYSLVVIQYYYLNTGMVSTVWLVIHASTIFAKQTEIWVSEIFAGVIFAVSESWTHIVSSCMAKS